jgi:hypothetical protein
MMIRKSGAGGRTRTGTGLSALRIFLPLRLSPPWSVGGSPPLAQVRGLDYPFTLVFAGQGDHVRCCPSSLYTFPGTFVPRAWLGIAI